MRRVTRRDSTSTVAGAFGQERAAAADRSRALQEALASRTVAGHAIDVGDCRELLSMLGLTALPAQDRRRPVKPFSPSTEEHAL